MKKNIAQLLIFISGILVIIYLLTSHVFSKPLTALLIATGINIISIPLYAGLLEIIFSCRNLPLAIQSQILFRNRDVRISIAYLFKIKSNGKFLLVKNRKGNYYQLVGGAYKTLPGAGVIFKRYKIKPDNRFETEHGIAKNDLRFRLPGKYVIRIIEWFNSRENRETSQWREFCEEMLTTNILDKYLFRYIDYRYTCTIQTPMQKAKNLACLEILIYEVFEFIPDTGQEKALNELYKKGDTSHVKWADEVLINSLGFNERTREIEYDIGAHTKWAVNEKYSKE